MNDLVGKIYKPSSKVNHLWGETDGNTRRTLPSLATFVFGLIYSNTGDNRVGDEMAVVVVVGVEMISRRSLRKKKECCSPAAERGSGP